MTKLTNKECFTKEIKAIKRIKQHLQLKNSVSEMKNTHAHFGKQHSRSTGTEEEHMEVKTSEHEAGNVEMTQVEEKRELSF